MTWRRFVPGIAAAETALALLASATGMLVYDGFFANSGHFPALGLACLIGGGTAALGSRRTWAAALLAVAGLGSVIIFGVFGGATSTVLNGMRGSWNRLLTASAPIDPWSELLVVPTMVMWATAFSSVLLVLRARSVLSPLVPPLAGFVFTLLVVGNQAGGHAIPTALFLVLALSLIAFRAHRTSGSTTVRIERKVARPIIALTAVGTTVAISALLGFVGGQTLPLASGERRFDPRDVLAPPVTSANALTPLAQLKKQLTETPPRTLFTVRIDSDDGDMSKVRTAALNVFDGATWTSADSFRVAGSHLSTDPAMLPSRTVTAHVVIKDFAGPHLPVVGWPTRLTSDEGGSGQFGFDRDSGVVVSAAPSVEGLSYTVMGEVGPTGENWDTMPNPSSDHLSEQSLPPGMPSALRDVVNRLNTPDVSPYTRLSRLEVALFNQDTRIDRPPGHSYAAITRLMTDTEKGKGYAEQHASAFAVLARAMGMPARVAVGYVLRNQQDGVYQVTTADAHAWPEVHFPGLGWRAFEPTALSPSAPGPRQPETPPAVPPPAVPTATNQAASPPPSPLVGRPDESGFGWGGVVRGTALVIPLLMVLAMFALMSVGAAKALRRKRRRNEPDNAAQVLGAWREQLDRLTERGVKLPVSMTFHEVAQHVQGSVGARAPLVEASALLATAAVYAPEDVGPQEAEQAWQLVERLYADLYPRHAFLERLRAAVDPRPLWTTWSTSRKRRQARQSLELGRYR